MNFFISNVFTCVVVLLALSTSCFADDLNIINFIPEIISSCPDCKPRLTVVNNCGDNAELLWKVTGNPQWDFLKSQGATTLYETPPSSNNKFYRFKLGAKGTTTAQKTFFIPEKGASSGAMYIMFGCTPTSGSDWDTCKIGGLPFTTFYTAVPLYEPSFGCSSTITDRTKCNKNLSNNQPLTPVDWFDMSAVNTYNIPFKLVVTDAATHSCAPAVNGIIDGSMLDMASCPSEGLGTMNMTAADKSSYADTWAVMQGGFSLLNTAQDGNGENYNKVCGAPQMWLTVPGFGNPSQPHGIGTDLTTNNTYDWYAAVGTENKALTSTDCTGPGCGGPQSYKGMNGDWTQSLPLTNYVKRLKEMGFLTAYTWPYDDAAANNNCTQGIHTVLTLCPNGGTPYSQSTKWWYNTDSSTNACVVVDASTPSSATQYTSLFDCQQQGINRYVLIKETLTSQNPNMLTQAIYYCTTHPASDGATVYEYTDCQTKVSACNAASTSGGTLPDYCPTS